MNAVTAVTSITELSNTESCLSSRRNTSPIVKTSLFKFTFIFTVLFDSYPDHRRYSTNRPSWVKLVPPANRPYGLVSGWKLTGKAAQTNHLFSWHRSEGIWTKPVIDDLLLLFFICKDRIIELSARPGTNSISSVQYNCATLATSRPAVEGT